jgi:antitoxin ParD1/3/4
LINIDKTPKGVVMPSSYAIGSHFERFIKKQIDSGRYSSASEVVRDALRLLEEREELREAQIRNLREQIQEGIHSGPGVPAEEVLTRLEAKYAKLRQKP